MFPQIQYSQKEKILSLRFSKRKSVDSDIRGNVVIDYDQDKRVVNVDIMEINLAAFVPVKAMERLAIEKRRSATYAR